MAAFLQAESNRHEMMIVQYFFIVSVILELSLFVFESALHLGLTQSRLLPEGQKHLQQHLHLLDF